MHREIKLPDDDRVLSLTIKTANDQQYSISLEFCAHEFGLENDDVQVSVHKLKNSEDGQSSRGILGPNAILHMEKPFAQKNNPEDMINWVIQF